MRCRLPFSSKTGVLDEKGRRLRLETNPTLFEQIVRISGPIGIGYNQNLVVKPLFFRKNTIVAFVFRCHPKPTFLDEKGKRNQFCNLTIYVNKVSNMSNSSSDVYERSLRDVCYKQIESNFWYGLFGDFKLIIDRDTGYFNATKLCAFGGKKFEGWSRNKQSKKLIEDFRQRHSNEDLPHRYFYEITGGEKDGIKNTTISGTYVPEDFILSIALWTSVEFYDKVNRIVKTYFVNEFIDKYKHNETLLKEKLQQLDSKLQKITSVVERYRFHEEDIAVKTSNPKKLHTFTIVKKNDPDAKYPYAAIRTQRVNHQNRVKRLTKKYPTMEIIWKLEYHPNALNLYNRIKEDVKNIKFNYTNIALMDDFTEEEFLQTIEKLADTHIISETE